MVDSEQDGTDDTPIQPVSSLRSHFEHMTEQKPSRSPLISVTQRKNVTERSYGQGDGQSHGLPPKGPLPEILAPQPASQSSGSRLIHLEIPGFGAHGEAGAKELKQHSAYSSLRQRPRSIGSPSSVPSPPTVVAKSPRSPPILPNLARMKPTYQPSTEAATPSAPKPKFQPFTSPQSPSNHLVPLSTDVEKAKFGEKLLPSPSHAKFRATSKADNGEFPNSDVPPSTDVNTREELTKTKPGNSSLYHAQRAAESDPGYISHPNFQHKKALPSEGTGSKNQTADTTRRTSSQLVGEQEFRPQLPPRQGADKRPEQLPQVSSRSSFDKTWADHRDDHKNPSKHTQARIPSAHQPPWSIVTPARTEIEPSLISYQNSDRSAGRADRLKNIPQLQNTSKTSDKAGTLKVDSTQRSTMGPSGPTAKIGEYPDTSSSNRRHPFSRHGVQMIETNYDTKLFEISNRYLCTSGYLTKAWDLTSGEMIMSTSLGEKELRVTALAFSPGATSEEEGAQVWLGNNYGDLYEIDISTQTILYTKSAAHSKHEVIRIFRYQNDMLTMDDDGRLNIWHGKEGDVPSLRKTPRMRKIPKGHIFSMLINDTLWVATGIGIRIFRPISDDDADFVVREEPLSQPGVGEVTSGAIIPGHLSVVYFGHADGKVTSYSTIDFSCLGIFNVSLYKINCLAGVGSYLWAGYSNGMIYVYDTNTMPWKTKKDWRAHDRPVTSILVGLHSILTSTQLQVASIGTDNTVRLWDGILEQDWLETDMHDHETDYCSFRKISATVVTWNAGASTPSSLRYEKHSRTFTEILHVETPSDLLVFGFQELVDLEDKKLTAKNILKGNKKKYSSEQDHMSSQYRAWRDYLVRCVEDNMPANEPYQLLHTASMVGLFSCVFVRASQRSYINNMNTAELKRGLGGLHGNKGALVFRFTFEDSSLCFVNCHLAAGQSQTIHRNNDASAIIEATILPSETNLTTGHSSFIGGGDGSMVLDHEICVLNGDLNYRIETMGRETVIKAIHAQQYSRLLERDQLLVSRRRNPGFRLRDFHESPILFAPTYKYDLGTDDYDTSEKRRTPAWCDRILYRGSGKVEQLEYRRHELQVSDHRPVSGVFVMSIKRIILSKRKEAWEACEERFQTFKRRLIEEIKLIT